MLQTNFEASYSPTAFEVVHIDTDNLSAAALHSHWDPDNPTFPVLVGCGSLYGQYGNGYIPYNVVLDTDGIVRYAAAGFSQTALHSVIQQYLTLPNPFFELQDVSILSDGNSDGRPDPGETVSFRIQLRNSPIAQAASAVSVQFTTADGDVTELQATANLGAVAPGATVQSAPAFTFTVNAAALPHWADFQFNIQATYAGGTWSQTLGHSQRIARPDLLLVDSDGTLDDNESFVQNALASLFTSYDMWTPSENGDLTVDEALAYQRIIWLGGIRNPDINTVERTALESFLDRGGLLLLSSQYASNDPLNGSLILRCGASTLSTSPGNLFLATSPAADPWFQNMTLVMTGSVGANNCVQPDNLVTQPGATAFATWSQGALAPAGVYRIGLSSNTVYCGFPIEALRLFSSYPNSVSLASFLSRVFAFHDANPTTPPEPVSDLAIECVLGECYLMWTAVPGVSAYRVYQSASPWVFPAQPFLETTEDFVHFPTPTSGGSYYQVRTVR